jgi:hypothetical protein
MVASAVLGRGVARARVDYFRDPPLGEREEENIYILIT